MGRRSYSEHMIEERFHLIQVAAAPRSDMDRDPCKLRQLVENPTVGNVLANRQVTPEEVH